MTIGERGEVRPSLNDLELMAVGVGFSNIADAIVAQEACFSGSRLSFVDQGFLMRAQRMVHQFSARTELGRELYDLVLFPLRSGTGVIDCRAQSKSLPDYSQSLGVFCFHHTTAFWLKEKNPTLPVFLWVQNAYPFRGNVYRGDVFHLGWHKDTLDEIKNRTGGDEKNFLYVPPLVPQFLVESFRFDNQARAERARSAELPLRVVYLPSGSGINVSNWSRFLELASTELESGKLEVVVNLACNLGQLRRYRPFFERTGIRTICDPDYRHVYDEVAKAISVADLLISVPGIWPRWAARLKIPNITEGNVRQKGRGLRGDPERHNALYFLDNFGFPISPLSEIPELLALGKPSKTKRTIRRMRAGLAEENSDDLNQKTIDAMREFVLEKLVFPRLF